jgi:hypothetical protein
MNRDRKKIAADYTAILIAAAAVYIITCAPTVLWQDNGLYQYRIWHNEIESKFGLALSHPLYHIIGIGVKYIPLGEFAYRVNLISAVAGAITIANLFLLLRLWLNKILPAVIAAVTLALSHTMWLHAVVAESYSLYTALLSTELVMLMQYVKTKRVVFLYLLALFNGLAIANHMLASLAFVCYLVFLITLLIKKQISLRHFGIIAGLWLIGAAPYEYLIIKNFIKAGDITATLSSAFFGKSWRGDVLNTSLSARIVKENLMLIAYNFPTPNIVFFFVGLYGLKKASSYHSFAKVLLALLVLFFVFAFRYTIKDRFTFFLPFYFLAAAFIGVGIHFFSNLYPRKLYTIVILAFAFLPLAAYKFVPGIAEKAKINLGTRRTIPYRNEYIWFLQPWKTCYKGAELFATEALDNAEPNAIIFADNTTVAPLLYVQDVKARRKDIKIISNLYTSENAPEFNEAVIEKLLDERAVYVVSPTKGNCPDFLLEQYTLKPAGVIWRVVEKQTK